MPRRDLEAIVEAILFASDEALSAERIAGALERQDATPSAVRDAIADLNEHYVQDERTFEIVEVAGGYKMMTVPDYNNYIRKILRGRSRERISQAALETLAVVAYRQPVTRADIDNIRGVDTGPMLRTLVDRGLIKIVGRDESLGHPLLYGTTKLFLEVFGLKDISSLPRVEELTKATPESILTEDDESEDFVVEEDVEGPDEVARSDEVRKAMSDMADQDNAVEEEAADDVGAGDGEVAVTDAEAGDAVEDESIIRLSNHMPEDGADEPSSDALTEDDSADDRDTH
ncbi:MAG: SMC-Scp complex subunit ScpB [Planctomycetes bacterium]|nr:SMC-Scp complex subunit ScpB [Planctomycetota bacterium]